MLRNKGGYTGEHLASSWLFNTVKMFFKEFDKSLNCIKRKVSSSVGGLETENQYCVKAFEYPLAGWRVQMT